MSKKHGKRPPPSPTDSESMDDPSRLTPVATYVRMSTEHQKYSTKNQLVAIERYADAHGMEVVQTYVDAGKSGLQVVGRTGMQQLIADVTNGHAKFEAILVYDVSRWVTISGPGRGRVLRTTVRARRHPIRVLRRAVQQRREPGLHHHQGRQEGHGRGVQPRAVHQGVRGPNAGSSHSAFARAAWPVTAFAGCGSIRPVSISGSSAPGNTRVCRPTA